MRHTILLILSLAALPAVAGNIYKWVDASGQTHYGETPPSDVQAQSQNQLRPKGSATFAPKPAAAAKPVSTAAASAARPGAKPPESAEDKAKRCTEAKSRAEFLEERTAYRLMIRQPDGSEARMTEEEFQERLGKTKATITEACEG